MAQRVKIQCDFHVKSSPASLYTFLTQPSGLIQWFADHVDTDEGDYIFTWDGAEERAVIIDKEENSYIKLKMEDYEDDEFLEFRIEKSEVSNDTILLVTDFADEDDQDDQRRLWDSQIDALRTCVGGKN